MLKLMYITNQVNIAKIAERSGVDWIFIDLEILGKEERQGHLDSVISRHSIEDVSQIKRALTVSKLLVRVNPINPNSNYEIKEVIDRGADIIMLPFFKSVAEVKEFINIVNKKAQICLLLETPEAVGIIDDILAISDIDYIHIGLNDLHLGYKLKFMFQLLVDGTVEKVTRKIRKTQIIYGFGGVAKLGKGKLPAEYIIAEHYRLESKMAILSRSFIDPNEYLDIYEFENSFSSGVREIRKYERYIEGLSSIFFDMNKNKIVKIVNEVIKEIG